MEGSLPALDVRLGHALAHDVQAPVHMLEPLLEYLFESGGNERLREAAMAGCANLRAVVAALVEALHAPIDLDGRMPRDDLAARLQAGWRKRAAEHDKLELRLAHGLPVAPPTGQALVDDLLDHALAYPMEAPRTVVVETGGDRLASWVTVMDDGPGPTTSPAGTVRPVAGSTARALLVCQRVAAAAAGEVRIETLSGMVRVTLSIPHRSEGSA